MADKAIQLSEADEAAIRALYQALLEAWSNGDAACYAALFSDETEYIIGSGQVQRGRAEITAGHAQIFETWAKHTRLFGEIQSIRPLASTLFLVIATGSILMPGQTQPDEKDMTLYSMIAEKRGSGWQFISYQNTPLQSKPDQA